MNRRLYIDVCAGEIRAVVTADGRPERLLIRRQGDAAGQILGARSIGRVRRLLKPAALAFVDIGAGPDAVLNLSAETPKLVEGQAVEVEVRTEARADRGAVLRLIGPAEGPPRLTSPAPGPAEVFASFAGGEPVTGAAARAAADLAQAEALERVFPLKGGGDISVEPTRALTAIDVDLGERDGPTPKRASSAANLAALAEAARVLRLKGLGGLVVIDLVGRAHNAPSLMAAARSAFAPDNPGVSIAPIGRFGTLEISLTRRTRPLADTLGAGPPGSDGTLLSDASLAAELARALEREGRANRGARLVGLAAPAVVAAAAPLLGWLEDRYGARFTLEPEPARSRAAFEVRIR
ncbi:MAG TPA: ribonuclease E/G [Caulobacteraceae bacterium]|jgi:Ribonuclease G/E|nr:ribonuclease E/G [Caulobacteraceae bacterium]